MFKIYKKDVTDIFLKLEESEDHDGSIDLVACNAGGRMYDHGRILRITQNGTIIRYENVNVNLGFKLDRLGIVTIEEVKQ